MIRHSKRHVTQRAFTLIEVLSVLSIIGLLIAVALASFGTAREKTLDKAIMATLMSVQLRGVSVFEKEGCYTALGMPCPPNPLVGFVSTCADVITGPLFFDDPDVSTLLRDAGSKGGQGFSSVMCRITYDKMSWVVAAPLRSDPGKYYCVDSSKNARIVTPLSVPGLGGASRLFTGTQCID